VTRSIRLRRNTLQLAAGMKSKANYGAIPQLAAGSFISLILLSSDHSASQLDQSICCFASWGHPR
jgi:hypothetical protein